MCESMNSNLPLHYAACTPPTATSGRRLAGALVQGPGVIAGKRVASIASIARVDSLNT